MAAIMLNPSASEFVPRSFALPASQPSHASNPANGFGPQLRTAAHDFSTPSQNLGPQPRLQPTSVSGFGSAFLSRHVPGSPGTSLELDESDMFECCSALALAHSTALLSAQASSDAALLAAISDVTPASEEPDSTRTSIASTASDLGKAIPMAAASHVSPSRMAAPPLAAAPRPSVAKSTAAPPIGAAVLRVPSAQSFAPFAGAPAVSTSSFVVPSPAPPPPLSVAGAAAVAAADAASDGDALSPLDLRCASAFATPSAGAATGLVPTRPALTKSSSVPSLLHAQLAAISAPTPATQLPSPKEDVVGEEDGAEHSAAVNSSRGGGDSANSGDGSSNSSSDGSGGNVGGSACCGAALTVPVGSIVAEVASGKPTLSRVGPQDFEVLRIVGQGAFGKVFQVTYKGDGRVYAMKVMRKDRIVQKDHSEYVRSERDVLTAVTHPYIVAMRFSFQTPSKLYLILDFVNGGHLFFNLYKQGVFSEEVARLYTAEIVSALSYLHGAGIVHRDLKPENVLLDHEGHVKITDFGLAKGNLHTESDRTNSFIGTMEYMAPEIIQSRGHGKAVDWWSTGILLYEMLCGMPPFRAKSRQALQTQIVSSKLKFPKFISSDAQSLLKGLLNRDVAKRLGSGPGGSEAVKRHPFFKGIHWVKLERREVESKFKPMVANSMCTANFDKIWTEQKAVDSPCGTPTTLAALAQHAHLFQGFSYVSPAFIVESVEAMKLRAASASPSGVVAALELSPNVVAAMELAQML